MAKKAVLLAIAVALALVVYALPRPEGDTWEINGDPEKKLATAAQKDFKEVPNPNKRSQGYLLQALSPGTAQGTAENLQKAMTANQLQGVKLDYVNGLSPRAKTFLAVLVFLIFLFVFEPVPLEITALSIGVLLVAAGVTDLKDAWAAYMHPVVVFIMCCLVFAIAMEKAGLTKRLAAAIGRKTGGSVVKFTFTIAITLGVASSVMHDAAAAAIGLATMLPIMRALGIEPYTNTAKFMTLSIPFAASCGGMGTLTGGGRCRVSAAFLKEFTGVELTFLDWTIFAMPAALLTVPAAVFVVWLVFRPDPKFKMPAAEGKAEPWSPIEIKTMLILLAVLVAWLTKSVHGLDYTITGGVAVALLVLLSVLEWEDIHKHLEWGTALFIFGGGIALGLAMDDSGAARYFANKFFPLVQGGGWLVLFAAVGIFGALVTNAMANVAAAALVMPIVLPMALLEGVDPRIIALCLGMATSFAMLLVIGCPPNAIAYSYRQFKAFDLTKAGLVATPLLLGILILVAAVWWRVLGLV